MNSPVFKPGVRSHWCILLLMSLLVSTGQEEATAGAQGHTAHSLTVATVQMRSTRDLTNNVERMSRAIADGAGKGARVVVFPECALTGYFEDSVTNLTAQAIQQAEQQICCACRQASVYAVVGSAYRQENKLFDSALIITPDGKVLERYHKIQLAEKWPDPGDHLSIFKIDQVPCSVIICHDERYPELVRLPILAGARLIFYISHESGLREEHKLNPYRAQIQARAVENTVFIVQANAPANPNATGSHGQSRIIGPDGNILQEASIFGEDMLVATLDPDKATADNARNSLRRGPLQDWWREGMQRVRVVDAAPARSQAEPSESSRKLLYVAEPGIRNYLEYGGHGLLVFDIERNHHFVKRIPTAGLDEHQVPLNVKGICANAGTRRLYVSTTRTVTALDLVTEKVLWEKAYEGGCDRLAITPDGRTLYLPSLEKEHWHVVDALSGDVRRKIVTDSGAHNTIVSLDGSRAYLAGLRSPLLRVTDTRSHEVVQEIGPFGNVIRPFTVDGQGRFCFVNVNDLLGFEVGDLRTGQVLHRVEVQGFSKGPTKRHGCPSHGVGLTPDEKELWLTDAHNRRIHVFDAAVMPPRQTISVELRDEPGWITFSIDGQYAYPSTGDVIDVCTRQIVAGLQDEHGAAVQSEKMLEIDFAGDQPVRVGDQFGVGRVTVH
jgi:predicted amidohydrolase